MVSKATRPWKSFPYFLKPVKTLEVGLKKHPALKRAKLSSVWAENPEVVQWKMSRPYFSDIWTSSFQRTCIQFIERTEVIPFPSFHLMFPLQLTLWVRLVTQMQLSNPGEEPVNTHTHAHAGTYQDSYINNQSLKTTRMTNENKLSEPKLSVFM